MANMKEAIILIRESWKMVSNQTIYSIYVKFIIVAPLKEIFHIFSIKRFISLSKSLSKSQRVVSSANNLHKTHTKNFVNYFRKNKIPKEIDHLA